MDLENKPNIVRHHQEEELLIESDQDDIMRDVQREIKASKELLAARLNEESEL